MSAALPKSSPTLDSRVKVANDVLFQELQGEGVLLNLDSGMYLGLDPVGTRIWQLIVEHERLDEVARSIEAEFEVTQEQCVADLLDLVAKLEREGLVTVSS